MLQYLKNLFVDEFELIQSKEFYSTIENPLILVLVQQMAIDFYPLQIKSLFSRELHAADDSLATYRPSTSHQ